ncbi:MULTISPECIES: elongation factor P [Thermodesulfobacterium]|jgi:elongation factor P|uniref:Elongation factor P n=1 Tax=Thermodesulfobacterium commune TaxID=1741 RepID=A0A101FKC1_9BACT|nr:elongation factor P [Thermodesulfobacterium sp.]KUJ97705.1 MAG: Elongation factor P [Thermodesulfobacterium sp. 37_54]KUK19482.1 MAG: Elongation factor P [Thermodesulfobacterium commune]KUK38614.1 MAG: Elongation factor P [Thermodesulfobacterium commune]MBZ4681135.1 elongation factor [Thermodesulfobacterium sp.]MDN5379130.1 elongation factor [Thermodesulfobacterium sp.]
MAYTTSDFRRGLKIEWEGKPYEILEFQHVKVSKNQPTVRTRLKDLTTGRVFEVNFRAGEKFEKPDLQEKEMQFLYKEKGQYVFMDLEDYDQVYLREEEVGEAAKFLKENLNVYIIYYRGKVIGIDLPNIVELEVIDTEPGVRGDTVGSATKPATLETGAVIQVPLFINKGDKIKVDTRTGEYIERAV